MQRQRKARSEPDLKRVFVLVALACVTGAAKAEKVDVVPSVTVTETYTDNVTAGAGGGNGEWITEIAPGISISRTGGRLSGELSATAPFRWYANDGSRNSSSITLNGQGDYVAIEDLLFVDFGASIQKENTSILGGPIGNELDPGNRELVRRFYIAPKLVFHLGSNTRGSAQYRRDWSSGGGGVLSGRTQSTATLDLSNPVAFGPFGWGLSYTDTRTDGGGDTSVVSEQVTRATLTFRVTPQFMLRAIAGHETNNYATGDSVDRSFTGGGFDWSPTTRTQISATMEDRFFGTGYNISFNHRRPLSSYELTYSRDVSSADSLSILSAADLFYPGIYASLEGTVPDPQERARQARILAQQLAQNFPSIGFVTNTEFLQTRVSAGVSLNGARNTLSIRIFRDEREALTPDLALVASDTFSAFNRTISKGASISLVHRLTPDSSVNATYSLTNSKGEGAASVEARQRAFTVGYSKPLGPHTNGSLTYRHQSSSGTSEYTENALIASVSMRF